MVTNAKSSNVIVNTLKFFGRILCQMLSTCDSKVLSIVFFPLIGILAQEVIHGHCSEVLRMPTMPFMVPNGNSSGVIMI